MLWNAVPGGIGEDGNVITKPEELATAELVVAILQKFPGYTYTSLLAEDVAFLGLLELTHCLEADNG